MTFRAGQRVRVDARAHVGHHRTPGYVKGKVGVVERKQGEFTDPETRAYGASEVRERALYLVRFAPDEVWARYRGSSRDRIYVDVFEHWLEEAV
jgi:nitrile hydratase beta subunit-like protein